MLHSDPPGGGRHVLAQRGSRWAAVLPFLPCILASLFWSGNWVIGRALRDTMPPVAMNFWRWTGAAVMLAPLVLPRMVGRWHVVRSHWRFFPLARGLRRAPFPVPVCVGLRMTEAVKSVLMEHLH